MNNQLPAPLQYLRVVANPIFIRACRALCFLFLAGLGLSTTNRDLWASDAPGANNTSARFNVTTYIVNGSPLLPAANLSSVFAPHIGTNLGISEIVKAATDLQIEYRNEGYPDVGVALASSEITNGVVTLNIFHSALPQIVVSGVRYSISTNYDFTQVALNAPANSTNTASAPKPPELATRGPDGRIHVSTNAPGPRFEVRKYEITGNTILFPDEIGAILTNIDGAFGTNVSFEGIRTVVSELQGGYRERGYVTVSVGLPQQKLTNATVKVSVVEGRLEDITVSGNRYFSSNNVMRSLPSLHNGTILNEPVFRSELNRANANQDRQIYPVVTPGPDPGTSDLTLKVKDQFPLHAKVELNNQNSPGTPDLRVNSSAVYGNLWQLEHSLGIQYSFSPQEYKQDDQWEFYDRPLVANYSGFYRLPLGGPEPVEDVIAANPGTFGYSEATRKFNTPPPSGQPELTLFASRSSIDTGLENLSSAVILDVPGVREIDRKDVQQDLTVNNDLGAHLSAPLETTANFHATFTTGMDYKTYQLTSSKTNNFLFSEIHLDAQGNPLPPVVSSVESPVPTTHQHLQYLPLSFHYDTGWKDPLGNGTFGIGLSANLWFDARTSSGTNSAHGVQALQQIAGSTKSHGHWMAITPSVSHTFEVVTNWTTTVHADGQWASEPLISNEQFGAGGVNSVRGYHEGEVFGDDGWHVTLEQQTPPHIVGTVYGRNPLIIRGSVYTDYARVYLIDPQGRNADTPLWGTGVGAVMSVGSHWEARFLCSWPLLRTSITEPYVPFFDFSLTAQF